MTPADISAPPPVVERNLLRRRLARALAIAADGDAKAAFLLDFVADDLLERLAAVERRFDVAVAAMGVTGRLAALMSQTGRVARLYRLEALPAAFASSPAEHAPGLVGDDEGWPFAADSLDLVVSPLALGFANDLPGTLVQIRRSLRPDGLLLAALAGAGTLAELRQAMASAELELTGGASPRVMPFADIRSLGDLLQRAGFALPVVDREVLSLRYDDAFALMAELKAMGASNPLTSRRRLPATRGLLRRCAQIYAETFSDADGRVRATFEIVYLSGWAPHESQQKPARRGSANISLAQALSGGSAGSLANGSEDEGGGA